MNNKFIIINNFYLNTDYSTQNIKRGITMNYLTKPHTIQSKLCSIILISTFMIAFIIVSICYTSFHKLLKNSLIESTTANLHLTMNALSSNMEPIINFSNWCSHKTIITNYLNHNNILHPTSTYSAWLQLREEYLNNASTHYMDRVVIGNDSSQYLHVSSIASFNAFNMVHTITNLPYFDTLYNSNNLEWIGIVPNPFSDDIGEQMLPIIRPVYSPYNTEKIGWVYLSISTHILTQTLSKETIPKDSKLLLTINEHSYNLLSPEFNEVDYIGSSSTPIEQKNAVITTQIDEMGNTHTYVTVTSPTLNGWYLTQSISQIEFKKQRNIYLLLLVLICFIILAIGLVLTFYLNQLINRPLNQILKKVNAIALGDFSYDPSIEWSNEFGKIGKGINHLSSNVIELMENRIQAEKYEKELEYQMLQSQINPHFLYNTLNSIKWMATIQQATGIAEMTTALARLMKAISKDTKSIVSLKDELELLDNYFLIQQYRYGGTISLHYDIDNDYKACQILKFTLQPIVENAIFHGIEPKGEAGHITIKAYKTLINHKEALRIDITDDGIGMTKEQIASLLSKGHHAGSDFFKKIGIHNVHQRILYAFGPDYGLSLQSEVGHFTIVSILLPYNLSVIKEDL